MGGSGSAECPGAEAAPANGAATSPPKAASQQGGKKREEKLLDKYTLGKSIGQGAFGIVYSCKLNASQEEFAVKMIDPVETPLEEIKREVEMLRLLAHPCVVAMRDVFFEKVFVCLVMEIYKGGDMIEGMQLHWKSKGQIPIPVIQKLSNMMVQGAEWLHSNSIVHRDLKGDNYLQSVKRLEDPNCRVYMSDFGTVMAINPGERLNSKVGTKTYWAPEFYRLDYGLPVDIWAIGVILFGMVTGRFPFKGEADAKGKEVRMPSRSTKDGEVFIAHTLKKNEAERFTATQCMKHVFLAQVQAHVDATQEEQEKVEGEVRERGANAGVKQRRRELVNRLEDVQQANLEGSRNVGVKWNVDFEVQDKRAEKVTMFEWWSPDKVETAQFLKGDAVKHVENIDPFAERQIAQKLEEHNVSTAKFGEGQAKQLSEFMAEVLSGESRLMLDATRHKNMVRVIDVVLVRIVFGKDANRRYLIKLSEKFPDGRIRDKLNNLPGTKKRPHESSRQTVERIVQDRLQLPQGLQLQSGLKWDFSTKEYMEDDEESPSYPGVRTVYRKEIYEGVVMSQDPEVFKQLGLSDGGTPGQYVVEGADKYTRTFCWASEGACYAKGIKFRAPKDGFEISPLVPTPVGYDEEQLQAFLEENQVDVTAFKEKGQGSLANLAEELQMGDAALTRMGDGRILRVVEVIVLKVARKNGDILVQAMQKTEGGSKKAERLPGVKRRQDENLFWAAHRLMEQTLKINENMVKMDADNVMLIEEEKPSEVYTNLPTIYRRRIIPASLIQE